MDEKTVERLKEQITEVQMEYIQKMIAVCDEYGADRDATLRQATTLLLETIKEKSFRYYDPES